MRLVMKIPSNNHKTKLAIMKLQRELEELGTSYTQEIEASDRQARALDELCIKYTTNTIKCLSWNYKQL